jgi:hypothetical protein
MSPINGLIYLRNYKLNIKQEEEWKKGNSKKKKKEIKNWKAIGKISENRN